MPDIMTSTKEVNIVITNMIDMAVVAAAAAVAAAPVVAAAPAAVAAVDTAVAAIMATVTMATVTDDAYEEMVL